MPSIEEGLLFGGFAFLALIVGWVAGRAQQRSSYRAAERLLPLKEYYRGINYLLNERPDQAVDTFIKNFEVTQETIETHLALGGLFRRRGEAARAIKIHQHLLARSSLNRPQQENVQLELARDYFAAGLYDRAQGLLNELVELGGRHRRSALSLLILIHEQFKEWEHCQQLGLQLLKVGDESMLIRLPHYLCETAEVTFHKGNLEEARQLVKRALQFDKKCVRALLLQTQLHVSTQDYKEALKTIRRLLSVDISVFPEVESTIQQIFAGLDQKSEYPQFVLSFLEKFSSVDLVEAYARWKAEHDSQAARTEFTQNNIQQYPYWRLFLYLVDQLALQQPDLVWINELKQKLVSSGLIHSQYTCTQCGFHRQHRFWQCPSCRYWGQVHRVSEMPSR